MKELFTPYTNWRIWVLLILSMPAFILVCSEPTSRTTLTAIVTVKAAGLLLVFITAWLARHWTKAGKLDELKDNDND